MLHSIFLNTMATKTPPKRHYEPLSTQATTTSKKQKPTLVHLPAKNDKKYTERELEDIERIRRLRYNVLLNCARRKDMSARLVFPTAEQFEIPMARVSHTLEQQVELLDIYHYLHDRKETLPIKLSHSSFGPMVGVYLSRYSLEGMLKREDKLRAAAKTHPMDAHHIVDRKGAMIEEVLYRWLQDQRILNVPVNGTILVDLQDNSGNTVSETPPSFSVAWFDDVADKTASKVSPSFSASGVNAFKGRYRITYCQLHGEAGSVDLEAIEPELTDIRQLCAQYTPDNIFNCDETGFYLQELDDKFYTTPGPKSGTKANRSCRVSILFCINASGSSIAVADTKNSLKPLVIGTSIPKDLEKDSADRMLMNETNSGWMNEDLFVKWLQMFDDDLSQPTLLLLGSTGVHNSIDMRDSGTNTPWKYLRIQRLPKSTTSIIQPLDAGVISLFKRVFLEMLSYETYLVRSNDKKEYISNELAWTLIPYAWSQVKPLTLRNCFAKTPVLPTEMREQLRLRQPTHAEQQQPLQYSRHNQYKEQERAYFEHLIAETTMENSWDFRVVGNKDEQELAEEALQVNVEGKGEDDQSEDEVSRDRCVSSPITDEEWGATIQTLKYLAGDYDVFSAEGLKQILQRTKHGSKDERDTREVVKKLVHALAAAGNENSSG